MYSEYEYDVYISVYMPYFESQQVIQNLPKSPKFQVPKRSPCTWPTRQIPGATRSHFDHGALGRQLPWVRHPWRGQSPAAGRKCCNKWHQRWL